jgi:hypothetical protein
MWLVIVIPFVAFLAALVFLWNGAVNALDLAILLGMYIPVALGVTVGYHRMLTHKAFDGPRPIRFFWLAMGSMSVEGGALSWAVDHRTHHAFSDREGDPHSPHHGYDGSSWRGALGGALARPRGLAVRPRAQAERVEVRQGPARRLDDRVVRADVLLLGHPELRAACPHRLAGDRADRGAACSAASSGAGSCASS